MNSYNIYPLKTEAKFLSQKLKLKCINWIIFSCKNSFLFLSYSSSFIIQICFWFGFLPHARPSWFGLPSHSPAWFGLLSENFVVIAFNGTSKRQDHLPSVAAICEWLTRFSDVKKCIYSPLKREKVELFRSKFGLFVTL